MNDDKIAAGQNLNLAIPVTNTGSRDGDEVVQVYLKKWMIQRDRLKRCVLLSVCVFRQERRLRLNFLWMIPSWNGGMNRAIQ